MSSRGVTAGMSLDDWGNSFDLDDEQRELLANAAKRLYQDPVLRRVLNVLEYVAADQFRQAASIKDSQSQMERIRQAQNMAQGIQEFRRGLRVMIEAPKLGEYEYRRDTLPEYDPLT